jgi:hypothetical protein
MYGNNGQQIRNEEDFTIEKEDFPALPGSQKHSDSGATSLHGLAGRDLGLVGGGASGAAGNIGSSAQAAQAAQAATQSAGQGDYSGGAFGNAGFDRTSGLNISGLIAGSAGGAPGAGASGGATATSTEARFGLGGLLDIIRMTDKVSVR